MKISYFRSHIIFIEVFLQLETLQPEIWLCY